MPLIRIFYAFLVLLLLGAGTCDSKSQDMFRQIADKNWYHSREEDQNGLKAYRAEGYAFPPSRGRAGFRLHADGTFVELAIARADGIEEKTGTWTKGQQPNTIQTNVAGNIQVIEYVSLTKGLLLVKPSKD